MVCCNLKNEVIEMVENSGSRDFSDETQNHPYAVTHFDDRKSNSNPMITQKFSILDMIRK